MVGHELILSNKRISIEVSVEKRMSLAFLFTFKNLDYRTPFYITPFYHIS